MTYAYYCWPYCDREMYNGNKKCCTFTSSCVLVAIWIVSRVHLHPYDAYRSLPVESMSCLRDRDDIY